MTGFRVRVTNVRIKDGKVTPKPSGYKAGVKARKAARLVKAWKAKRP